MSIDSTILQLIKETPGLTAISVTEELCAMGHDLTYETVSERLRSMMRGGVLERQAIGKPWFYYYYSADIGLGYAQPTLGEFGNEEEIQ